MRVPNETKAADLAASVRPRIAVEQSRSHAELESRRRHHRPLLPAKWASALRMKYTRRRCHAHEHQDVT